MGENQGTDCPLLLLLSLSARTHVGYQQYIGIVENLLQLLECCQFQQLINVNNAPCRSLEKMRIIFRKVDLEHDACSHLKL